jgi:hypothetical protein
MQTLTLITLLGCAERDGADRQTADPTDPAPGDVGPIAPPELEPPVGTGVGVADVTAATDVDPADGHAGVDTTSYADGGGGQQGSDPELYWPVEVTSTVCRDGSADHLDIQDAIDVAGFGEVIGVCPGTYGPISVLWLQSVTILGIEGPEVTAIDGAGLPAVYIREGTLNLSGFRLTGTGYIEEWEPDAGCVTVYEGDAVITDSVVADCTGPFALMFDEDTLEMHDVRWENNDTRYLWYLWQGEDDDGPVGWATFTHNTVVGGVHETLVETTKLVHLTLTNSLFADVTIDGGYSGFILNEFEDGPLLVTNNVFYNVDSLDPWGARLFDSDADFRNNIVVGCDAWDLLPMEASYSLFWDNGVDYGPHLEGDGNLFVDPAFTDPASLDFTLQPGSPAIDAGDPDPAFDDPDGTRNDIGIYGGPG